MRNVIAAVAVSAVTASFALAVFHIRGSDPQTGHVHNLVAPPQIPDDVWEERSSGRPMGFFPWSGVEGYSYSTPTRRPSPDATKQQVSAPSQFDKAGQDTVEQLVPSASYGNTYATVEADFFQTVAQPVASDQIPLPPLQPAFPHTLMPIAEPSKIPSISPTVPSPSPTVEAPSIVVTPTGPPIPAPTENQPLNPGGDETPDESDIPGQPGYFGDQPASEVSEAPENGGNKLDAVTPSPTPSSAPDPEDTADVTENN